MAYGTIKADTLTYDNSGSDANLTVSSIAGKVDSASPTFTGNVTLNAAGDLRLADSDSSNYVGFKSPGTVASNLVWTLPAADGSANQFLKTNGSGVLSWASDTSTDASKLPLDGSGVMTGNLVFEGSTANDFETTVTPTDATADRTITLPDATGTVALGVIGTDIQAYDADTVKKDVAQSFTASQRGKVHALGSQGNLNIPLDSGQHFTITSTADSSALTFTDLDADAVGQSGVIYLTNGAYTHTYAGHVKKASGVTIGSTAGDYVIPYTVIATDKVVIDVIAVA